MSLFTYKLKRELSRIKQQLKAIPEFFYEPLIRFQHDRLRSKTLIPNDGAIENKKNKIAIFLVYQPKGISKSTIWTCQYLASKGYAPLVVSNAPIDPDNKKEISAVSWKIIERPNFGYDFGGYRDGIWLLQKLNNHPDHLLILNDSFWFPLYEDDTLLENMEAAEEAFVGALELDPIRDSQNVPLKKRPFFGSFFWHFKKSAIEHPSFINFWQHYKSTSNKYKTIRRGERNFSHHMKDSGISSRAILSRKIFDEKIDGMSASDLILVLKNLNHFDKSLEKKIIQTISAFEDSSKWKMTARADIKKATEKQNIMTTAPIALLNFFHVGFIKKSKELDNRRAIYLINNNVKLNQIKMPHESIWNEMNRG